MKKLINLQEKQKPASNIIRRFLANPIDKKVVCYALDKIGNLLPCHNIDLIWLFKNRDFIKTGFKSKEAAKRWLHDFGRRTK